MRTNRNGVTEVASIRTDQDKYAENYEHIFGKKIPEKLEEKICLIDEQIFEAWFDEHATKELADMIYEKEKWIPFKRMSYIGYNAAIKLKGLK